MSGPYDDIIELPHPTSTKHSRMPISDRASIFSPFAALTGHGDAIRETARLTEQKMELDEDAKAELDVLAKAVTTVTRETAKSFADDDSKRARKVEPMEQVVDHLCSNMKARHIKRLQDGACRVEQGMLFTDVLGDCARISDHCSNVAAAIIELHHDSYDTHQYLGDLRSDPEFKELYQEYLAQYPLP